MCIICIGIMAGCEKDKKEVLRVGMEIAYPPFEYYQEDTGKPAGIDVELAYALGNELGMEVKLINTSWDGIFDGLNNDVYDCVISGCTITEERLKDYSFTIPYLQNYQCIVSLKDSDIKISQPSEISGMRIGYQMDTVSDEFISHYAVENNIEYEEYEYAKIIDCFSDLAQGRIDAIACDSPVAETYTSGEDSIYEITWAADSDPEEFGICVKQGNTELLEDLNEALVAITESGKLQDIIGSNIQGE